MKSPPAIEKSHCALAFPSTDPPSIDDATCADLDLDEVFVRLDRSRSAAGQGISYSWLRRPALEAAALGERTALLRFFAERPAQREAAQKVLARIGKPRRADAVSELWGEAGDGYLKYRSLYRAWMVAMFAILGASAFIGWLPLALLGTGLVNIVLFMRTTSYIGSHMDAICYLSALLWGQKRLRRILGQGAGDPAPGALGRFDRVAGEIPDGIRFLHSPPGLSGDLVSLLIDYYRIFLLGELGAYFAFYAAFAKRRAELRGLFEAIGAIDAAAGLAEALAEDGRLRPCSPGGEGYAFREMVHPLVEGCVPSSLETGRGIVVTGTNMAGKTTFLRAWGVNQTLACAYGLAYAAEYRTPFAPVISSIRISDDLLEGKSRYLAEAERLLERLGFGRFLDQAGDTC